MDFDKTDENTMILLGRGYQMIGMYLKGNELIKKGEGYVIMNFNGEFDVRS